MRITYTSDTGSRSFWLILYDSRPIYHRMSTDIPPTLNGLSIGRVSAAISIDTRPMFRSTYRPTLSRYLGQYFPRTVFQNRGRLPRNKNWSDRHISADISVDMSTDISRPIHRPSVGRYVDRYIGRVSVDMSTDMSVEGCTKYTWSQVPLQRWTFWNWKRLAQLCRKFFLKTFGRHVCDILLGDLARDFRIDFFKDRTISKLLRQARSLALGGCVGSEIKFPKRRN